MSVDIANLTLCHNIAWRFLPSLFRQSSITRLPGFTSIKLAEENWNRLSYDTRIQFLVQLQLAPAACEGAHIIMYTIHHNIMCPGARLHTYTTHLPYHTITQQNYLLTGRSPRSACHSKITSPQHTKLKTIWRYVEWVLLRESEFSYVHFWLR